MRLSPEKTAALAERNAKIMKLHHLGIEGKIIAQRFGLVPAAISYIIKKHTRPTAKGAVPPVPETKK